MIDTQAIIKYSYCNLSNLANPLKQLIALSLQYHCLKALFNELICYNGHYGNLPN